MLGRLESLLWPAVPSAGAGPGPAARRLLRLGELLLRVLCVSLCALLCWQAVQRYREERVHTAMMVVETGVPNITVCPAQGVAETQRGATRRWAAGNISQLEYVRQADRPLADILRRCFAGGPSCCLPECPQGAVRLGHWQEVLVPGPTRPLLCHRLRLNESDGALVVRNGGLSLDLAPPADGRRTGGLYEVLPHHAERPVLLYGVGPRSASVTAALDDGRPQHVALRVTAEVVRSISRRRRPCRSRAGYSQQGCRIACWHAAAALAVGCRALGFDSEPSVPLCGNASSLAELYAALYEQPTRPTLCSCPAACQVVKHYGGQESRFFPAAPYPTVTVVLSQWTTVVQEQLNTTAQQLAAELGGLLGLLLGVSAWTLAGVPWCAVSALSSRRRAPPAVRLRSRPRWRQDRAISTIA